MIRITVTFRHQQVTTERPITELNNDAQDQELE